MKLSIPRLRGVGALFAVAILAASAVAAQGATRHDRHIAGAKRYQVAQISDRDVSLSGAAVQEFIQSDLFHKISANPNFGKTILVPAENGKVVLVKVENGRTVKVPAENGKTVKVPTENGKTVNVPTENGKTVLVPTENGKTVHVPAPQELEEGGE
jgi:hypothetical protein